MNPSLIPQYQQIQNQKQYKTIESESIKISSNLSEKIKAITTNIKVYCQTIFSNSTNQQCIQNYKQIIKDQLQQFEVLSQPYLTLSSNQQEIKGLKFYKNIDRFGQIIQQLSTLRSSALENDMKNKIQNMINGFIQQMIVIIQENKHTFQRLQQYDVYANNIKNQNDECQNEKINKQYQQTSESKDIQIIKFNSYLPVEAFHFISPSLHKNYIYEAAKAYQPISIIKIKNIISPNIKREQKPNINIKNYFKSQSQKMIVCCSIPNTKILAYYNLNQISHALTIDSEFYRQIELKMKWVFSKETKIIVTPQGRIFGINCRNTSSKIDPTIYQFTTQKVIKRAEMIIAKRQAGFIYLNNCLYIIGGKNENGKVSSTNYKYILKQKKIVQISNSNTSLRKPTICTVNNRFIFKLGGINQFEYVSKVIQIYDTMTNKWLLVRATPKNYYEQVEILQNSMAVQINKQQIYIFGGININKTDTGFILHLNDIAKEGCNTNIKVTGELCNVSIGSRNLISFLGVISSDNVIVHDHCLYFLRIETTS